MSNETKVPAIPHSSDPAVKALKEALEVRLGRRGDTLDRAITVRELYENGVISLSGMPSIPANKMRPIQPIDTTKDTSIPPAPTNVTAAGAFVGILVSWDKPARKDLIAEIWRNTVDDRTSAVLSGVAQGFIFSDLVGHGKTYYYWVRYVSEAGTIGPFNAVDGVQGVTNKSVTEVMEDLNDAIGKTQLDATLKAEIDKITPLAGLQETAETLETLLGQAQSGSSAVEILRNTINNELSTLTVDWSGLDGTEGLQAEIDQLIIDADILKTAITGKIATETVTWEGDPDDTTSVGLKAEITTAVGDATDFKTGVTGHVNTKNIEWEGADGTGGIKAGISTELVSASNFKTGVNTHVDSQTTTWEGTEGNGGVKAAITSELTTANNLKTGIATQTETDEITWQGVDGNGGIKAGLTTELTTATNLKTGINTTTSSKQMDWEGADGTGGTKAALQDEYTTAVNLKTGIKTEADSKSLSWEGNDGTGGVKAAISTELASAVSLKEGIAGEVDSKTISWEGDPDDPTVAGTKAELTSEYTTAVSLKEGIKLEADSKSLSWEGSDGTGGVKAGITSNLTEASNLKAGIQGTTNTKTITWEGTDGTGGVQAAISTAISTANSLKSGIISTTSTKEATWQGADGKGGIKAGISEAIDDATDLKSGITTHTNTKNIAWEGSDGNGGVKAGLSESLVNITTLKTGIDSEHYTKNQNWVGADGDGGVKAALKLTYDNAVNLKNGISAEVSTKTTSWQGSDGNGGVKADITSYLGDASDLKTGVSAFVNTKTQTWEGTTGTGGVKAEITTALTAATNLKNGITSTKDEKYLAWNGGTDTSGNAIVGIKNEIIQVEDFFANLPANYISDIKTLQSTFGSGENLSTVITQQGTVVDKLKTQQFVKSDSNGHIAGYGLYNSTSYSEFAVKADVFKIASGSSTVQPFIVVAGNGLTIVSATQQFADTTKEWRDSNYPDAKWFAPGTYIDTAFIADASIDVAKIGNLSVDFANVTGSLSASQIAAINITAEQISTGTLSGHTITGGKIISGRASMKDGVIEGVKIKGSVLEGSTVISGVSALTTQTGGSHACHPLGVSASASASASNTLTTKLDIHAANYSDTTPPSGKTAGDSYWRYRKYDAFFGSLPTITCSFKWGGYTTPKTNTGHYGSRTYNVFSVRIDVLEGDTSVSNQTKTMSVYTSYTTSSITRSISFDVKGYTASASITYARAGHDDGYGTKTYWAAVGAQTVTLSVTPKSSYDFRNSTANGLGFKVTLTPIQGSVTSQTLSMSHTAHNDY